MAAHQKPKQRRNTSGTNDKKDSNPEARNNNIPSDFEEFWARVPKKQGKGDARRAFAAAIKKTTPKIIIEAMSHFAETRVGQDPKFTVSPAKWLNSER